MGKEGTFRVSLSLSTCIVNHDDLFNYSLVIGKGLGVFFSWMPPKTLSSGPAKMVYSNESMTDKNGLEVNHFEPAPPMHDAGGIQEKNTPSPQPTVQRLIEVLLNTKNTSPNLRVRALGQGQVSKIL